MKILRKYALGALLMMALACNAIAKSDDNKQKSKDKNKTTYSYPNEYKSKDKGKNKRVYSVPEAGATILLLGASVAVLVLSQRRIARVE